MNKKKIFLLIILVLVAMPLVFVGLKSISQPANNNKQDQSETVTPATSGKSQAVSYDKAGSAELATILRTRPQLSSNDLLIKNALIKQANPLYKNDNITIEYLPEEDIFQTEIHTIRIETAQNQAVAWLRSRGMSNAGICKLPLTFYVNEKDAESLKGLDIVIDPLPPSCQEEK